NDYTQPSCPRHAPTVGGIPIKASTSSAPMPKVVSVSVQYVESEKLTSPSKSKSSSESESESALRIQKAWREFRVRKNVKKIV
ncbi:hypothetical protein Ancab_018218, partial [Ancistrocladus abbreviatus]